MNYFIAFLTRRRILYCSIHQRYLPRFSAR